MGPAQPQMVLDCAQRLTALARYVPDGLSFGRRVAQDTTATGVGECGTKEY
jgi:hypothetical protein